MSNNAIFLRSKNVKRISGKNIVLFYHAYDYEVSALNRIKQYGSEATYERIVNQREDKAIKLCETHSAVYGCVLADKWTAISTGGTPVYEIAQNEFRLTENPDNKIVGFVIRTGYQYVYYSYEEAPAFYKERFPCQTAEKNSHLIL